MFTSIMRVLHEMLPCSRNFFNQKRKYRLAQQEQNENIGEIRKIREIASPRVVRGLSLGRSPSRRLSSRGQSVGSQGNDISSRFSSMQQQQMPDVRVKKNMSREHVRNSSRQNKEIMSSANERNFLPELSDLSGREDNNRSPMGSPMGKKLNMQTKIRNKNGPSHIDFGHTSSFSDIDSGTQSPITPSKGFGLRNNFQRKGENPRRSNYT